MRSAEFVQFVIEWSVIMIWFAEIIRDDVSGHTVSSSGVLRSEMFFPSRLSGFRGYSLALCLGHGLESAFAADLAAFASYLSHVLREAGRRYRRRFRCRLLNGSLAGGLVNNPFCELIGVAWPFAFADGHSGPILPLLLSLFSSISLTSSVRYRISLMYLRPKILFADNSSNRTIMN